MRFLFTALPIATVIMLLASTTLAAQSEVRHTEVSEHVVAASGRVGDGLTLDQAITRALHSSPDLAAGVLAVSAAEARVSQAALLPNPELELEAENFGGSDELDGFNAAESTVVISQPILLGGKRGRRRAVAESEQALAALDLEAVRLDVISGTTSAFFSVLAAQQRHALADELLGLAERFRRTVQARVDAGKVSPVEATRASIESAQARVRRARAARELEAARVHLAATWGSSTTRFAVVVGDLPEPTPPRPLEQLRPLMLKSPDISRLEHEIQRQHNVLELERSFRVPDLTVRLGPRRFEETGQSAWVAGLSLPLPVFDRNQGSRRAAEFELEKTRRDADSIRVAREAELTATHERLRAAAQEATAMVREVLPAAESAFAATELGYSEGKFGFLDVLDAQRALFEVRSLLLDSRTEYALTRTQLLRLAGRGAHAEPEVASDDPHPSQGEQQ